MATSTIKNVNKHTIQSIVELMNYTSSYYTFPDDGYLFMATNNQSSSNCTCKITDENEQREMNMTVTNGQSILIYVRCGLKVKFVKSADAYCGYYQLT